MNKLLPKGHRSLGDPAFRYTPSEHTDIGKTFARVRKQMLEQHVTPEEWAYVSAAEVIRHAKEDS